MESKPKKSTGLIIGLVIFVLIIGGVAFYLGKNYNTIFSTKVTSKDELNTGTNKEDKEVTTDKNSKETLDINTTFVQTLYTKVKGITKDRCLSADATYELTPDLKRILAFENMPTSERKSLSVPEFNYTYGLGGRGFEEEINFQYSSAALHNSYLNLFGKDELVDEEFADIFTGMNFYNSTTKSYANINFQGGCMPTIKYKNSLLSAEKTGTKIELKEKVEVEWIAEGTTPNQGQPGTYQYDLVFDDNVKQYIITDFKKVS